MDLYVAGAPCQPFSTAGKRKGWADIRAKLMDKSSRYIQRRLPPVFVLENVSAWRKQRRYRPGYLKFKAALQMAGYDIFTKDMKTSDHGLPQARVRTYMVGFRRSLKVKKFEFPEPLAWGCLHPMHCLLDDASIDGNQNTSSNTFTRNLRTAFSFLFQNPKQFKIPLFMFNVFFSQFQILTVQCTVCNACQESNSGMQGTGH